MDDFDLDLELVSALGAGGADALEAALPLPAKLRRGAHTHRGGARGCPPPPRGGARTRKGGRFSPDEEEDSPDTTPRHSDEGEHSGHNTRVRSGRHSRSS